MKTASINNLTNQRNTIFQGGLSKPLKSEILTTDCCKIQDLLLKEQNIKADFANNKFIAWSVYNVVKLFNDLKKKSGVRIELPTNIITADLEDYNVENKGLVYGFTNFLPCRFSNKNNDVVPGMSIIFNKNFPWEKIDEISDYDFSKKYTTTDYFLESFIHEFCHILHEGNLLKRHSPEVLPQKLNIMTDEKNIQKYRNEFGADIEKKLCKHALESPLDLIACDMSCEIINNIDQNNLKIKKDPFNSYAYSNNIFKTLFFDKNKLDIFIKNIFNGNVKIFD